MLIFGLGISIMVAPLTTALMRSVPGRQAGLASAINNAISRVGPQLAGALIFVVVTATFYSALQVRAPELNMDDPQVRRTIPPLSRPEPEVPPAHVLAAREASTEAFRLAMLTSAGLLLLGALVNAVGISDRQARAAGGSGAAGSAAGGRGVGDGSVAGGGGAGDGSVAPGAGAA